MSLFFDETTTAKCAQCGDVVELTSGNGDVNPGIKYAWFDVEKNSPCCSKRCRDLHEDDWGDDYREEFDPEQVLKLLIDRGYHE